MSEAGSPTAPAASKPTPNTSNNGKNVVTSVPSSKGLRPWKAPKQRTAASQRRTASLKLSLEEKNRRREKRDALRKVVQAAKEADRVAKEAERERRQAKKKQKEENARRGVKPVVITNPKKLARMSKKQYLNYVKTHKVLN